MCIITDELFTYISGLMYFFFFFVFIYYYCNLLNMPEMAHDWINTSILFYSMCLYKLEAYTRGIWKVHSMVFYLSNGLTNPFMFGIILKCYLFSMT